MSNICDFERILKTDFNFQHFTKNCRMRNLDDFERHEPDAYLTWTFKCEGETSYHMLHYKQVFGNFFERKARKCCGVLIKHRHKVKGEQVITLQMAQKLKTKNINVVPG